MFSDNFLRKEFDCNCGNCEPIAVDHELITVLEDLRSYFGKQITVTSGYRCPDHNAAVGGHPKSKHMLGIAADIKVAGVYPQAVYNYLNEKYPDKYGIGLYSAWVHIDVQEKRLRW